MGKSSNRNYLVSDQGVASIIGFEKDQRIAEEVLSLIKQDAAFETASEQVRKIKDFVGRPSEILGNPLTKHGEIAEQVEVGIRNARSAIEQKTMTATFEGVGRTAPEDYLIGNTEVQAKFINGANNNLSHVLDHMSKYEEFTKSGIYHIPKDTHELICAVKNGDVPLEELSQKSQDAILRKVQEVEKLTGKPFEDVVQPSLSKYSDVQQGNIHDTLDGHEKDLKERNNQAREEIHDKHSPSIEGALQAAGVSAVVGGAVSLATSLYQHHKEGKKLLNGDLSRDDWKKIGIDATKGAGIGAVSGAALYALTNNVGLSAPFAGAVVSATQGVYRLYESYKSDDISFEEFTEQGLLICAESAIVGLATFAGQTLIPIPVLGAAIGSLSGKLLAELVTGKSEKTAKRIAEKMNYDIEVLKKTLEQSYQEVLTSIDDVFDRLESFTEAAFDLENNLKLVDASVALANVYGVNEKDIITTYEELDDFMLA